MAYDKVVDSAVLDAGLKQIADAIREKAGTTDALAFPQEIADAIAAIQSGGATIEPLTITENGTYTAPDGVDGYSPVTVDVKSSGGELVLTDFSYFCYKGTRISVLDQLDTSNGTNFNAMLYGCESLTTIPELDTSNGTNFSSMFYNCKSITTIPELDTSNGTNFTSMFSGCSAITTIPELDTSNGTAFGYMFYNCIKLKTIHELDTSNGTNFSNMFSSCSAITTIPELDTSNGTTFGYMFYNCKSITTIPELDTSNGTDFTYMFKGCSAITTIPKLDVSNGTTFGDMFRKCSALKNLYLYNIRKTIQIGSSTSWGHLLTVDSLVHTIKELCTATTSQTLTIGPANLEKIAGLYCRITDDTNEKKPMELCESTDEGAMTLVDYAMEKNWAIQ